MKRERAKQLAPIIKAFGNGEDIQFHDGDDWSDIGGEGIEADALENGGLKYRFKPKPREFWLNTMSNTIHDGDERPDYRLDSKWIKVREVLS